MFAKWAIQINSRLTVFSSDSLFLIFAPQFHAIGRQKARSQLPHFWGVNRFEARLEARKPGYPGRKQMKINMADQVQRLPENMKFSEKQDLKMQWI